MKSMTQNTNYFDIKLLKYNQVQKEIIVNEALMKIDALISRCAKSFISSIDELMNENDIYIVAENPTGECSNKAHHIMYYANGWRYVNPKKGLIFWIDAYQSNFIFDGNTWRLMSRGSLDIDSDGGIINLNDNYNKYKIHASRDISIKYPKYSQKKQQYLGVGDVEIDIIICTKDTRISVNWEDTVVWDKDNNVSDISARTICFMSLKRIETEEKSIWCGFVNGRLAC